MFVLMQQRTRIKHVPIKTGIKFGLICLLFMPVMMQHVLWQRERERKNEDGEQIVRSWTNAEPRHWDDMLEMHALEKKRCALFEIIAYHYDVFYSLAYYFQNAHCEINGYLPGKGMDYGLKVRYFTRTKKPKKKN